MTGSCRSWPRSTASDQSSAIRAQADALVGPLIDRDAYRSDASARSTRRARPGGTVHGGRPRRRQRRRLLLCCGPRWSRCPMQADCVREETFAPILYVLKYRPISTRRSRCRTTCRKASPRPSFATDMREIEQFLSADRLRLRHRQRQHGHVGRRDRRRVRRREGNRRWPRKRLRQPGRPICAAKTNAINYGRPLPLAQGVTFDVNAGDAA
jgi:aldehyde dehydrogenase (NAD+)